MNDNNRMGIEITEEQRCTLETILRKKALNELDMLLDTIQPLDIISLALSVFDLTEHTTEYSVVKVFEDEKFSSLDSMIDSFYIDHWGFALCRKIQLFNISSQTVRFARIQFSISRNYENIFIGITSGYEDETIKHEFPYEESVKKIMSVSRKSKIIFTPTN